MSLRRSPTFFEAGASAILHKMSECCVGLGSFGPIRRCARTPAQGHDFDGTVRDETRREAEMTVERLVQEFKLERTDIFVAAAGMENTAGEETAGSDVEAGEPSVDERHDAALNGSIEVSVHVEDENKANLIRQAFAEFRAHDIEEA
ncbi:hypothetical protein VQ042_23865 [Aurantimonas sp. A2-1-M11]|uniref:hypothetical protein n=1 Tax=Aurantimonas sp. A2-1-M11 TaxID=3113712 RepID=UPI002F932257